MAIMYRLMSRVIFVKMLCEKQDEKWLSGRIFREVVHGLLRRQRSKLFRAVMHPNDSLYDLRRSFLCITLVFNNCLLKVLIYSSYLVLEIIITYLINSCYTTYSYMNSNEQGIT